MALGGFTLSASVLTACTPFHTTSEPSTPTRGIVTPTPLDSSVAGPETSWAVLAMGHLDEPTNTFWQMFYRSGPSSRWELATPPGVASNGGLTATIGPSGTVTAGFEPSQGLVFSPLAQTADQGTSWSQGVLPGGLAPVPDALATSGDHHFLALLRDGGGAVVTNGGDLTSWTTITSARNLAASRSSAACGITEFGAITEGTTGDPVVGAACARGSRPGSSSPWTDRGTRSGRYFRAGRRARPGCSASSTPRLVSPHSSAPARRPAPCSPCGGPTGRARGRCPHRYTCRPSSRRPVSRRRAVWSSSPAETGAVEWPRSPLHQAVIGSRCLPHRRERR